MWILTENLLKPIKISAETIRVDSGVGVSWQVCFSLLETWAPVWCIPGQDLFVSLRTAQLHCTMQPQLEMLTPLIFLSHASARRTHETAQARHNCTLEI